MSTKVVIDRNTWGRGSFTYGHSCLYHASTKQMCCLGFVCHQAYDISLDDISEMPYPSDIGVPPNPMQDVKHSLKFDGYNSISASFDHLIGFINDDCTITDESKREMMIADMLLYFFDIEVEYIN